ncbi:MAG: hypothetical protein HY062_17105 [Bacteroidetes bacterium]|nr:hypothetical protein [Bacteroidota bacterium]
MRYFLLIISVLTCMSSVAQHNHGGDEENDKALFKYAPQHGGEIVAAGKYKLEIVSNPLQKEEKLLVYMLKKNDKEIALKEASAKIVVQYKDDKTDTLKMEMHNGHFVTADIDLTLPVRIFFEIQIGHKTVTASYYYEGLKKHSHENH